MQKFILKHTYLFKGSGQSPYILYGTTLKSDCCVLCASNNISFMRIYVHENSMLYSKRQKSQVFSERILFVKMKGILPNNKKVDK